jgi:hypothetical protein
MNVIERYKLIFRWAGVSYDGSVATFNKAWFTGPVLKIAQQVQPNDYISLDFTAQNLKSGLFIPDNFYIANLRWKEVKYAEDAVMLGSCTLSHNRSGSLKELQDGFEFIIDCFKHDETTHYKFLVYPAWVVKNGRAL